MVGVPQGGNLRSVGDLKRSSTDRAAQVLTLNLSIQGHFPLRHKISNGEVPARDWVSQGWIAALLTCSSLWLQSGGGWRRLLSAALNLVARGLPFRTLNYSEAPHQRPNVTAPVELMPPWLLGF